MMLQILLGLACTAGVPATGPAHSQYALATVGGQALPALWQETELLGGARLRAFWVSGQARFCSDSTYHIALTLRATGPGVLGQPVVVTMTGTWEKTGRDGRLVVRPSRGGEVRWQMRGDTLALRARVASVPGGSLAPAQFVFVRRS